MPSNPIYVTETWNKKLAIIGSSEKITKKIKVNFLYLNCGHLKHFNALLIQQTEWYNYI